MRICRPWQMIRTEERRTLQDLYISLGAVCTELEEAVRIATAEAEEFRSVAAGAEAQALLATDRGPQALLGGDGALCSAFTLLDSHRQRLQLIQEQHEAGLAAVESAAAGNASGGLGPPKEGASGGGFNAAQCMASPRTAAAGGGIGMGSNGGVASAAPPAGNAFLDSILSDPAHRTVSHLAAGVDAVLGLLGRIEQQVQHRVSGQLTRLVSEGRRRVEEMRQMLASPSNHLPTQASSQQLAGDAMQMQAPIQLHGGAQQQTPIPNARSGGGTTAIAVASGPAAQKVSMWPVLRDPAFEAELAGTKADVERVLVDIQVFVARQNMLLDSHRRQSEQSRLERGVLAAFWNAPEQLLCDVQALRDRIGALLNSQ